MGDLLTPEVIAAVHVILGAILGWVIRHYGVGMGAKAATTGLAVANKVADPAKHPLLNLALTTVNAHIEAAVRDAVVNAVKKTIASGTTPANNHATATATVEVPRPS